MNVPFLKGSIVALVTPFRNGKVDEGALERLVDLHIREGTTAISPCGTTGESPTLTHDEHHEVVAAVVRFAGGRIPVVAGTGSNATEEAVSLTRHAERSGADAALLITPYYNRPNADGILAHYRAISDRTGLPLVVYNVPARTGLNLAPELVARLAGIPRVAAIKEASGSVEQAMRIRSLTDLPILSGDDALTLPILAIGGAGVVSVAANLVPRRMTELAARGLAGDFAEARRIHDELFPLFRALFVETNPIPVKAMMEEVGLASGELRLPLAPLSPENRDACRKVLEGLGLLSARGLARRRPGKVRAAAG